MKKKKNEKELEELFIQEAASNLTKIEGYNPRWKYSYYGEYSYDRSDCVCRDDNTDYCRCTSIVSSEIESINFDGIVEDITKDKSFPIINYCIDRILRNNELYDTKNYEVDVSPGYYGQEVNGIQPKDMSVFDKSIAELKSLIGLSDLDKIKKVLELEYGYLLPQIKASTFFEIKKISPSDIIFPQTEYRKKIKAKDTDFYSEFKLMRAIVDQQLHIIDGYHRITSALSKNLKTIEVIVLK